MSKKKILDCQPGMNVSTPNYNGHIVEMRRGPGLGVVDVHFREGDGWRTYPAALRVDVWDE